MLLFVQKHLQYYVFLGGFIGRRMPGFLIFSGFLNFYKLRRNRNRTGGKMKKLSSMFSLGLIFLLFSSCERSDLTEELKLTYASAADDYYCRDHPYRCENGNSYRCHFYDYYDDNDTYAELAEKCLYGCDDSTGKCNTSDDFCTTVDGTMWTLRSFYGMDWYDAVSYCNSLTACGYSDWHLPTISELRTLIQNCSGTVTGGSCGITDDCLSYESCWSYGCNHCEYRENNGGYYSKLDDDDVWLWSSSTPTPSASDCCAWGVSFVSGTVSSLGRFGINHVRCIR